jgi:hypothetical protein
MRANLVALVLPVFAALLIGCSGGEAYNTGTDPAKDQAEILAGKSAPYKGRRKVTKPPGPRINTNLSTKPVDNL